MVICMGNEQVLKRNIDTLRSKASALPRLPGVYIMKDAAGEIIAAAVLAGSFHG